MTKRSVKERHLQQQKHRYVRWRDRIKPPYTCPICFHPSSIRVKKQKIKRVEESNNKKEFFLEFEFTVWCERGCFKTTITHSSTIYEPVDAYCEALDQIRVSA